jgi:hypothetical protein
MKCHIEHDQYSQHPAVAPDDHGMGRQSVALRIIMPKYGIGCSMDKILQDSLYNP